MQHGNTEKLVVLGVDHRRDFLAVTGDKFVCREDLHGHWVTDGAYMPKAEKVLQEIYDGPQATGQ